jgi:PleD family two-component response regulator
LGYRVQSVSSAALLATACDDEMPLVVIAELAPTTAACAAIAQLRSSPATQHIPVLGFARTHDAALQSQAREAGVTLLAADAGIAEQLPQLLDRILQVE